MNKRTNRPFEHLDQIPKAPGVYFFKDKKGAVLYIGKAKDLRKRISQYRDGRITSHQTTTMLSKATIIDFVIAPNEVESLIWENNLIKEHQPKYNIRLRDDKGYIYIRISNEPYPKITTSHRPINDGAEYIGPYTSSEYVATTLKTLRRIFPYRTCNTLPQKPCLYFFLKLCPAPCVDKVTQKAYNATIQSIRQVLAGKSHDVVNGLKKEMLEYSSIHKFEEAAKTRDRIKALESVSGKYQEHESDEDIVSIYKEGKNAAMHLMMIRNQKMIRHETMLFDRADLLSENDIMETCIIATYQHALQLPRLIIASHEPSNKTLLQLWLKQRAKELQQAPPRIILPERGSKKRLVKIGLRNAEEKIKWSEAKSFLQEKETEAALKELQSVLRLPTLPKRIECYDMSNIQGTNAVGSMVVLKNGRPKNSEYRRFVIKTVQGANDFAMMQEVLSRRLEHHEWPHPDLFLLDGGRGQLSAVLQVFLKKNIRTPLAALAKREEEIYLPGKLHPVRLPKSSKALHLLQTIRDEAHRFAITHFRSRYTKSTFRSMLDTIEGLGPQTKTKLLRTFGSPEAIERAPTKELEAVIGKRKAALLQTYLRRQESFQRSNNEI